MKTERDAYIALNMMGKIGPIAVRSFVEVLGSARAIFEADREDLTRAERVGPGIAACVLSQRDGADPEAEVERAGKAGARIVTQVDAEYPRQLLEIHDPPLAMYVRGALEARDKHAIAVVGTRHPTTYGRECAERFAWQLCQAGFAVVSGLAQGIDTAAHRGALKAKGRTLAVLGGGLDSVYPEANLELAREIAERGAVLTEFPMGRQPDRTTFAIRNRIISGLSMGVLVVEAGRKSGALITADQALEQGRSVFAVPGRIDSYASQGTHELIRRGARLASCVDDILGEFEFLIPSGRPQRPESRPRPELTEEEQTLATLVEQEPRDVDSLIRGSGLTASRVGSLLIGLEMKRVIRMLPGRMVEKVR